jgi:hypothetical protein
MAPGEIVVTIAGVDAATLSADEAAALAEALWEIGLASRTRGAIAISDALKAAAHRSNLRPHVELRDGDQDAVRDALNDLNSTGDHHGFDSLSDALESSPAGE